jgi:hypothetical protein
VENWINYFLSFFQKTLRYIYVKTLKREILKMNKKQITDFLCGETETKPKVRLTSVQKKALDAYKFAVQQEDNYLGSVFVNSVGQKKYEAKTKEAYEYAMKVFPVELHTFYF